jgi:L-lactate dehydrogenase complex protein LldG
MNSRDLILDRVRRNQPGASSMPELPAFGRPLPSPLQSFTVALERMGGRVAPVPDGTPLDQALRELFPQATVIVSATPEVRGTRDVAEARRAPQMLDDVDIGVVRAAFGVAETGSVLLSEREFVVNALGFLPQHLVVLLDPQAIVPDLHHAYRERAFYEARYATLMTGPSATADIEGVLIRGAQGIRSLTVIARAAPGSAAG